MKDLIITRAMLYEVTQKIVESSVRTIPDDVKEEILACAEAETNPLSKRSLISFSLHCVLFMRYSLSPDL